MTKTHRMYQMRVDNATPAIVDQIAKDLGCMRISPDGALVGSTGVLLDQIAQGKLKIVVSEPEGD